MEISKNKSKINLKIDRVPLEAGSQPEGLGPKLEAYVTLNSFYLLSYLLREKFVLKFPSGNVCTEMFSR